MKIRKDIQNGFTLIELLIVIAIIGILAGVILVSTSSARTKARDAAIISSANSMMKAAQVDWVATGNYSAWEVGTMDLAVMNGDPNKCDDHYAGTSQPASARVACKSIMKNQGDYSLADEWGPWSSTSGGAASNLWSSTWGANHPRLSLMVWLPGENKYYCIGSNGGSSKITNLDGSGCDGIATWNCSGCAGDDSANGS